MQNPEKKVGYKYGQDKLIWKEVVIQFYNNVTYKFTKGDEYIILVLLIN